MSGLTIIGGNSANNAFSVQITPQAAVPAGAMIVVAIATEAPDVTPVQVTDTKGNTYNVQVDSQPPGSSTSLFVFYVKPTEAIALTTADRITVTMPQRFQIVAGALYYTGAQGSFTSSDVEWFAGTQCSFGVAQGIRGTRRQHQSATFRGERFRGGKADTAAGAGNQNDLVLELQVHQMTPSRRNPATSSAL